MFAFSSVLAPAARGDDAAQSAEVRKPMFEDGQTKWYGERVLLGTREPAPNECQRRFPGSTTDVAPQDGRLKIMCLKVLDERLTPEQVETVRAANEQQSTMPPSKQMKGAKLWAAQFPRDLRKSECPPGMKYEQHFVESNTNVCEYYNWNHCVVDLIMRCSAMLESKQFCPKGELFLGDRKCIVTTCPNGYESIQERTGLRIPGCYRCPAPGVIDLKETALAAHVDPRQVLQYGQPDGFTAILCREGPATTPEPTKIRSKASTPPNKR